MALGSDWSKQGPFRELWKTDDQKCLLTLPNVPLWGKITPGWESLPGGSWVPTWHPRIGSPPENRANSQQAELREGKEDNNRVTLCPEKACPAARLNLPFHRNFEIPPPSVFRLSWFKMNLLLFAPEIILILPKCFSKESSEVWWRHWIKESESLKHAQLVRGMGQLPRVPCSESPQEIKFQSGTIFQRRVCAQNHPQDTGITYREHIHIGAETREI